MLLSFLRFFCNQIDFFFDVITENPNIPAMKEVHLRIGPFCCKHVALTRTRINNSLAIVSSSLYHPQRNHVKIYAQKRTHYHTSLSKLACMVIHNINENIVINSSCFTPLNRVK